MTRFHRITGALAGVTILSGCVTQPFDPVALPPLGDRQPDALRREVAATTPDAFSMLQTAVFEYRRRSMTALCVTGIDTPERAFHIAAVTPVGMKLLEISGRDGIVETHFIAPGLEDRGDPAQAIARDIQRVYFDRVPSRDADTSRFAHKIIYSRPTADATIEHVLGGTPAVLLEKRKRDRRGLVWSVTYHDYRDHAGQLHPGGIVFTHRRYGYRLILRLKDLLSDPSDPTGNSPSTP